MLALRTCQQKEHASKDNMPAKKHASKNNMLVKERFQCKTEEEWPAKIQIKEAKKTFLQIVLTS